MTTPPAMPSTASAWRQPISLDEPPAERCEDGAGEAAGDSDDREGAMATGRVECDEHGHRRLVQGGGHGGADHDPCQVQHRRCSARSAKASIPIVPTSEPVGEHEPWVEPGERGGDRRSPEPGDQQAEREGSGDDAVGPAGVAR